ncbi:MAG: DUF4097 family beta strand repeat protein [Candidatus Riflebacteria bacterium]|nr:DUF4097 family beta strand repeat protein [Candidatus Riflebacteria bacterium]
MSEARKRILSMLAESRISVEQAEELLSAMETDDKSRIKTPEKSFSNGFTSMVDEIQKQVGKAVKSIQPQSKELKNKLKGLGDWISDAVGKVVTDIKLSQNEPIDGTSIECMVPAPENYSKCEKVEICNVWGSIIVHDTDDFSLKVKGKISKSALGEDSHVEWLKKNIVSVKDNTLVIGFDKSSVEKAALEIEVFMPASMPLTIKSLSANVDINGPFKISALESTSGSVKMKHAILSGTAIETVSSDVEVIGGTIALTAKTTSGDFRLKDCTVERFQIQSVSGDIEIVNPKFSDDAAMEMNSTSGDISITRPQGGVKRLEARTRSGSLQIRWPGRNQPLERNGTLLENTDPGASIKAESISGDLIFD